MMDWSSGPLSPLPVKVPPNRHKMKAECNPNRADPSVSSYLTVKAWEYMMHYQRD